MIDPNTIRSPYLRHGNRNSQNLYRVNSGGTETFVGVAMTGELAEELIAAYNAQVVINQPKENTMSTTTETVDKLEKVVIVTDGGVGGRGRQTGVLLTPEDARELREWALARNKG